MEFIVKGKLNKKYFRGVEEKLSRLLPVPAYIEKIFVTDHRKHAAVMFKDFPKTIGKAFAHQFEQERTSMALTHGEIEVIVVLVSGTNSYLKTNQRACVGTIAHELTHVLHKREGLYEYMDACFENNFSKYFAELAKSKTAPKAQELAAIAANLGSTASYVLKDLYMIQELISRGLGDYVLEDYYQQLSRPIAPPKLYANFKNANKEQMLAAINYELSLLTVVLPFEAYPNPKAKKLMQAIHKRYEKNIPEVVKEFLGLDRLYDEEFGWSWEFQRKFFTEVFKSAAALLATSN